MSVNQHPIVHHCLRGYLAVIGKAELIAPDPLLFGGKFGIMNRSKVPIPAPRILSPAAPNFLLLLNYFVVRWQV